MKEKETIRIKFKDLSIPLKTGAVVSWLLLAGWILFIFGWG